MNSTAAPAMRNAGIEMCIASSAYCAKYRKNISTRSDTKTPTTATLRPIARIELLGRVQKDRHRADRIEHDEQRDQIIDVIGVIDHRSPLSENISRPSRQLTPAAAEFARRRAPASSARSPARP